MTEEEKREYIWYAYRDTQELYNEGMEVEQLEEILLLYEEEELYLHCAGIKEAIDDIKQSERKIK
jgi:hypothetical protein